MTGNAAYGAGRHVSRWRMAIWGLVALLLLASYVSTLVTGEGSWTAFDYLVFGTMLVIAGGAFELAARCMGNRLYRAAVAVAVCSAFVLVWVNLAVGIIGHESNPANLMYAGVLAVGLTGAVLARLRPRGMARALVATALAQGLAAIIALVAGWGQTFPVTAFFVSLWLLSAHLFRRSDVVDESR